MEDPRVNSPAAETIEEETASERAPDTADEAAGPAPEADHERKLELDLQELEAKAEKADEYLELAQRTKADFEIGRASCRERVSYHV